MQAKEIAESMRKIADVIEQRWDIMPDIKKSCLSPGEQIGGAAVLNFLIECFKDSTKESFTKSEVLDILHLVSKDKEIFSIDYLGLIGAE